MDLSWTEGTAVLCSGVEQYREHIPLLTSLHPVRVNQLVDERIEIRLGAPQTALARERQAAHEGGQGQGPMLLT